MDTLLCDLCSSAIPRQHLTDGRAARIAGKLLCANCSQATPTASMGSVTRVGAAPARIGAVPAAVNKVGSVRTVAPLPPAAKPSNTSTRILPQGKPVQIVQRVGPSTPGTAKPNPARAPSPSSEYNLKPAVRSPSTRNVPAPAASARMPAVGAPAPSASGPRKTIRLNLAEQSGSGRLSVFTCPSCNLALTMADLSSGQAVMFGGKTWCLKCFESRPQAGKTLRHFAVGVGLVGVILAAVFPSQALFGVSTLALALCAYGLLDFEAARRWRMLCVFGGLAIAGSGFFLLSNIDRKKEAKDVLAPLRPTVAKLEEQLAQGQGLDAYRTLQQLQRQASPRAGQFLNAEAQTLVEEQEHRYAAWLEKTYPDCDEGGRNVMLKLLESFPENGGKHFGGVLLNGPDLSLKLMVAEDKLATGSKAPPGHEDVWQVFVFIFTNSQAIGSVNVELSIGGGASKHFKATRKDFEDIRTSLDPPSMLKTEAQK